MEGGETIVINEMSRQNTSATILPTAVLKDTFDTRKSSNGNTYFKDVFGGAVSSENTKKADGNTLKNGKDNIRQNDIKENNYVKSFRELQKAIKNEVRKNVVRTDESVSGEDNGNDKLESKEDSDEEKNVINEAAVNCFASMMGIKPEEFMSIMDKAGISDAELSTLKDIEGLAGKIAALADLNSEQKNMLAEMMKSAVNKLQTIPDTQKTDNADSTDYEAAKLSIKINADADDNSGEMNVSIKTMVKGDISAAQELLQSGLVKLRIKLQESGNKTETENTVVSDSNVAKPENILTSVQNNSESADSKSSTENEFKKPVETALKVEKETTKTTEKNSSEVVKTAEAAGNKNDAASTVNPLNINQLQKNDIHALQEKTDIKITIQAKEVVNQVIEKAKIIITPDKSEMVMDLKPESLGKLSLKVVTEQGIVMARFVAESEQVKQILESNMQLLKDSLEKQGMSVQGFSVSVKQDNRSSTGNWQNGDTQRQTFTGRAANGIRNEGIMAAIDASGSLSKSNAYRWGNSTISFTA